MLSPRKFLKVLLLDVFENALFDREALLSDEEAFSLDDCLRELSRSSDRFVLEKKGEDVGVGVGCLPSWVLREGNPC
ncbi:MAG: hypothetical protein HYV97_05325 [Bdellovibrio sp.]|nr:hypothetical protein [Bdellovibrio sp.]